MDEHDDKGLLARAAKGETEAFRTLMQRITQRFFGLRIALPAPSNLQRTLHKNAS